MYSIYNFQKSFLSRFNNLLNEKYKDISKSKRRTSFCAEYDKKYNRAMSDIVKNWYREKNATLPNIDILLELCNFFSCDIDYLLGKQSEKKKEYKAISEFTKLSEIAAEEIMNMNDTEQELLDRLFIVQPGMLYIVSEMLKVASYIHQNGSIEIKLPDGEARAEYTDQLAITLNSYDTKSLLSYSLHRVIDDVIENVLSDVEMQEKAHKEMLEHYKKHPFSYRPKGVVLSAEYLPKLKPNKNKERIDADETT